MEVSASHMRLIGWLLIFTSAGIAAWSPISSALDLGIAFAFGFVPAAVCMLALQARRSSGPVLLGAGVGLAALPPIAHLAVAVSRHGGQWWWAYLLLLPGAVAGTVVLLVFRREPVAESAVTTSARSLGLFIIPVAINFIVLSARS